MGNYYKGYRRFGREKHKKTALFFGGLLILCLVLIQCTSAGASVKSALRKGSDGAFALWQETRTRVASVFGGEKASFAVPVSSGVVVEDFGVIADADGNEAYHNGIDIQVPVGSDVLAAADGVVEDISNHDDGSLWLTLKHEQNWSTVYGRLGKTVVKVGDSVAKGDVLGSPMGEILHFEVREKETEKDPVGFFQSSAEE